MSETTKLAGHDAVEYVIQTRVATAGAPWQREASSPTYPSRREAELAAEALEPTNDGGQELEYRVAAA